MPGGDQSSISAAPFPDPLADLCDRNALLSALFRETDRSQRTRIPLCLLLIGIDAPNGSDPHSDAMIWSKLFQHVASQIMRQLRSYDLLGRLDEDDALLAVLPGCDPVNAASLAERISRSVFVKRFVAGFELIELRASFGIASSEGRSPIVGLREAEESLRQARKSCAAFVRDYCATGSASISGSDGAPRNS